MEEPKPESGPQLLTSIAEDERKPSLYYNLPLRGEELNYKTRWAPDKTVAMDDF